MKDRQVEHSAPQQRIPIVSAVLHCVTMSAAVYLRSGFGYAYLGPKSIFLSGSWAFLLFTIFAWNEPRMWQRFAGLCLFGIVACALYTFHLVRAFGSELRGTAKHDNYSGTPHLIRILNSAGVQLPLEARALWTIWAEPALMLLAALLARWPLGSETLSAWLLLVAPCLWLKEALNHWLQLRQRKRQSDAMEDAEDSIDVIHPQNEFSSSTASRKPKVSRQRTP
jgi:hypothetical protein